MTGGRTAPAQLRRGRLEPLPTHARWRSTRVNVYLYAAVMLVLFLGVIQASRAVGAWSTSGRVTGTGQPVVITGQDPSEIKGWMTIQDVTTSYGVTSEDFYKQFGIPASTPATTQLKDLEQAAPGFSVDAVRSWLRERSAPPGG